MVYLDKGFIFTKTERSVFSVMKHICNNKSGLNSEVKEITTQICPRHLAVPHTLYHVLMVVSSTLALDDTERHELACWPLLFVPSFVQALIESLLDSTHFVNDTASEMEKTRFLSTVAYRCAAMKALLIVKCMRRVISH